MNICRLRGPMALIIQELARIFRLPQGRKKGECALESRSGRQHGAIDGNRGTAIHGGITTLGSTTEPPVNTSASSPTETGS